jgi:TonB family protein
MLAQLGSGDFVAASESGKEVVSRLSSVIKKAANELVRAANSADLDFRPARLKCTRGLAPHDAAADVRVTRPAAPMDFYPSSAIVREEEGDIAVRVRVAANGCVSGIAVPVSSGYPALDDAAVQVAEHTRYAPAARDGQPIDGEITYMVRFALE